MRLLSNARIVYPAVGHRRWPGGQCWLRLYVDPDRNSAVAIVTELADNEGPSVTNSAEAIRPILLERLAAEDMDGCDLTVYEHYNDFLSYGRPLRARRSMGDSFSLQAPDGAGGTRFRHAIGAEVTAACGVDQLARLPMEDA